MYVVFCHFNGLWFCGIVRPPRPFEGLRILVVGHQRDRQKFFSSTLRLWQWNWNTAAIQMRRKFHSPARAPHRTTRWFNPRTLPCSARYRIGWMVGRFSDAGIWQHNRMRTCHSLVPIRCYGHHGPAVRRGLKTHSKIPSTTSGAFRSTTPVVCHA